MPHSRGDLQSYRSMQLLGIKSWHSPCVCWMTITDSLCHHTSCLCSCTALQPVLKQTEWEITPYALVPPAQIKIVLPLKTMDAGCTLTQSIGYRGLITAWRKQKLCAVNYERVCNKLWTLGHLPQLSVQWQATWFTTPSTQNPSLPPRLSITEMQILLHNSHWFSRTLFPTYDKMLSLSAPHFRGLTYSSIPPTASRAADLAQLLLDCRR